MKKLGYLYGVPSLDNFIYKLCYRWTVLILIVFSFVITCKLRFGYSFYCKYSSEITVSEATLKCYGSDLYHLPAGFKLKSDEAEDKRHYLNYYSWVNLLFLVHAFNFYLPHLLWKSCERGYMYKLTSGIRNCVNKEGKRDLELSRMAKYVFATQGKHKLYTLLYISSEILNFVISLSHAFWLASFFNITAVPDSIPYVVNTWSDFKNFYFPRFPAFCQFGEFNRYEYGILDSHRGRCELPLNDLYMYMYLFLSAWYIAVALLTALMLLYRICLLVPSVRIFFFKISSPLSSILILKSKCHQMPYSDWFFLLRLQCTMFDVDFAHLIEKIAIVSQGKDPQSNELEFTVLGDTTKDLDSSNIISHV